MSYKKPKRFFEKSGIVDPSASYYVQLENVTKINRSNIQKNLERAVDQLCEKYLLTEQSDEGCIVVFDIKTMLGDLCTPRRREVAGKQVLIFNIAIGR